jgi:hypothetical protein
MANQLLSEKGQGFIDVFDRDEWHSSQILNTENRVRCLRSTSEQEASKAVKSLANPID